MMWHSLLRVSVIALPATLVFMGGCEGGGPSFSIDSLVEDIAPPTPGETARDAFNVYDPDQRRKSIVKLSNAPWGGEEPYLKTYRLLVDDPDPTVRAACIAALGRHGYADDVSRITPYLRDPSYVVRWEAAKALQRLHNETAIDPLIAALRDDEEPDVRVAAAKALGQYAEPRVFQALVGALNDDDYAVVTEAKTSLTFMTGEDHGENGADWLSWSETRGEKLFTDSEPYTYTAYIARPTFPQRMQFWRDWPESPGPQEPVRTSTPIATAEATEPVLPPLPDQPAATPAPTPTPRATTTHPAVDNATPSPLRPADTTKPTPGTQPKPAPRPATQPVPAPKPAVAPQPRPQPRPATTTPQPTPQPTVKQPAQPQPPATTTAPKTLIRRAPDTTVPSTTTQPAARPVTISDADLTKPRGPIHPLGATDGRRSRMTSDQPADGEKKDQKKKDDEPKKDDEESTEKAAVQERRDEKK